MSAITRINAATDLGDLIEILRELDATGELEYVDITDLPTFGGTEPPDTQGVWSWDETSMIVGSCVGTGEFAGDFRIVSRSEYLSDGQPEQITLDDPRATALRDWLNERHRAYAEHPVTDTQLAVWLSEAEDSLDGLVEIHARDSVSGSPETYIVPAAVAGSEGI